MCGTCEGIMSSFCPACSDAFGDLCPCDEPCTCLDGWIYMNEDGKVLTIEEWEKLPEDDRVKDNCQLCNPARKVNGKWVFNK